MLRWLRRGLAGPRGSRGSMGAVLGVLDQIWAPGAAKAREQREAQHEQVMPAPTPGDRLLKDGRAVIRRQRR